MATKQELLNAMKVIKEHCISNGSYCDICLIGNECDKYFYTNICPCEWDLEEGEPNE